MSFSLLELLIPGLAYLIFLFGTAYLAEKGKLPSRLVHHWGVQVLSLGVYASAWTFFGAFELIQQSGLIFLASYLGATAAFLLAPILLVPIFNITERYQLSSLADLFAFRFRSGAVGTLTALLLLFASLPLMLLQIQAVSESLQLLHQDVGSGLIAAGFCIIIALFAILFGTRNPSLRASNHGLVVAMATGALIKLAVLIGFAWYSYFDILGGPAGASHWLSETPEAIKLVANKAEEESWRTLLLAFFTSTIVMPQMFHLLFTENRSEQNLLKASWGMPLYLLLLALAVPVISWGAMKLGVDTDSFTLLHISHALNSEWLAMLGFIGGLAAASGVMIVAAVSLASMLQNHLILPLMVAPDNIQFYNWLLWLRRLMITVVISISYLFYLRFGADNELQLLGISAFIAFLQFLPGLLATLFWTGANSRGLIAGLCIGIASWFLTTFYPLVIRQAAVLGDFDIGHLSWQFTALLSLALNTLVMVVVSLLTDTDEHEQQAAEACLYNSLERPSNQHQTFQPDDIIHLLAPRIGAQAAYRELQRSLNFLHINPDQMSPLDLLRLRKQLEQNLSALIGPVEAASLLAPLSSNPSGSGFQARDIHLLESQLENYQQRLGGLAAELDEIRRHHRITLQKLPLGALTIDQERRILFWNTEMEQLTGLKDYQVIGLLLHELPAPWGETLGPFASSRENHIAELQLEIEGNRYWYSFHKNRLSDQHDSSTVILLENYTEHHRLEQTLSHNERLASIGRFSAGVAHEIGNPVTGIACLAQNLSLETDNPEVLESGQQILEQTQRISRIVQSLVRFAHAGEQQQQSEHGPVAIDKLTDEAIHLVSLDSRGKGQMYINDLPEGLLVEGDAQQLMQVMVNLLNNACDASPDKGKIIISAEQLQPIVTICITDEGSGIDEHHRGRLFEPFFTTKEPGKGTGLGLALVYNIVTEHYGSIEIVSPANKKQNKGTQVKITLPGFPSTA